MCTCIQRPETLKRPYRPQTRLINFDGDICLEETVDGKKAKNVKDEIFKSKATDLSTSQVYSLKQYWSKNKYDHWMEDLSKLPSLIMYLRQIDPEGVYMLYTKPLSYREKLMKSLKIAGEKSRSAVDVSAESDTSTVQISADARELVGFLIIPSFLKSWWNQYPSRIMTVDMAHCTGQFRRVQVSSVSRNGYEENIKTSLGYFPIENKQSWTLFFS